jgi:hypothetical protein
MSAPETPLDLLDLKLMPAWVNEPAAANEYADHSGEDNSPLFERRGPRPDRGRDQRPRGPKPGGNRGPRPGGDRRDDRKRPEGRRPERPMRDNRERPPREAPAPLPQVAVRFLPNPAAFDSVIAQIKSGALAYSVFALARLFLDKAERYSARLTAADGAELYRLGENGPVATDRRILEGGAFAAMKDEFYTVEVTQTEPLKGNFTNVARERISGTLLGPTNHHAYQPQLRNLYEQRFSRRVSFQDFQRQIEIVSDPAVVEQWKEQARSITTYTTKGEETPVTFNSAADAERHFRQTHLPTLLRTAQEMTINGVISRALPDRGLGRVIEDAWAAEIRSPSKMMQELAGGLRQAGLNIFRHRRGMLYVSPIRTRAFGHDRTSVSATVTGILDKLSETPGLNRKQLLEKFTPEGADDLEIGRVKMTLAPDLRWLISEGYVIEFNDGSLDLPRTKPPAPAGAEQKQGAAAVAEPAVPPAPDMTPVIDEGPTAEGEDVGGMAVEQSIAPSEQQAGEEPAPTAAEAEVAELPASDGPAVAKAGSAAETAPVASSASDESAPSEAAVEGSAPDDAQSPTTLSEGSASGPS